MTNIIRPITESLSRPRTLQILNRTLQSIPVGVAFTADQFSHLVDHVMQTEMPTAAIGGATSYQFLKEQESSSDLGVRTVGVGNQSMRGFFRQSGDCVPLVETSDSLAGVNPWMEIASRHLNVIKGIFKEMGVAETVPNLQDPVGAVAEAKVRLEPKVEAPAKETLIDGKTSRDIAIVHSHLETMAKMMGYAPLNGIVTLAEAAAEVEGRLDELCQSLAGCLGEIGDTYTSARVAAARIRAYLRELQKPAAEPKGVNKNAAPVPTDNQEALAALLLVLTEEANTKGGFLTTKRGKTKLADPFSSISRMLRIPVRVDAEQVQMTVCTNDVMLTLAWTGEGTLKEAMDVTPILPSVVVDPRSILDQN